MALSKSVFALLILSVTLSLVFPAAGLKVVELDSKGEVIELHQKDLVRKMAKVAPAKVAPSEMVAATTTSLDDDASKNTEDIGSLEEISKKADDKFGTTTSFCYEGRKVGSWTRNSCWDKKPKSAPACTPSSGTSPCRCAKDSDNGCNIDFLADSTVPTPATGRCAEQTIYVDKGVAKKDSKGDIDVTGTTEERFCSKMVVSDKWKSKKLVAEAADGPESKPKTGWTCGSGYYSKTVEGKKVCLRGKRFLKEICWGGSSSSGKCVGTETAFEEYSTSCYKKAGAEYGQCMPYAFVQARSECQCAWSGWNFLVVCSAKNDACSGHACVWNTGTHKGNGKMYCDYATEQNWNTMR